MHFDASAADVLDDGLEFGILPHAGVGAD
jgi:hypothetical protein